MIPMDTPSVGDGAVGVDGSLFPHAATQNDNDEQMTSNQGAGGRKPKDIAPKLSAGSGPSRSSGTSVDSRIHSDGALRPRVVVLSPRR